MNKVLVIAFLLISFTGVGQNPESVKSKEKQLQETAVLTWLADLNEKGLEIIGDSLIMGREFQKVMNDAEYRKLIYPETYKWDEALLFLKNKYLKQAFWIFINLYSENENNKQLVLKSVLAYDELLEMDEMMVNSFYSYCFMDPQISVIKEGKPEIDRPDILEAKLRNVKEIVSYIHVYRKQQQEVANEE